MGSQRDFNVFLETLTKEAAGAAGVADSAAPSEEQKFVLEGEFVPPSRDSISVIYDPETGFPDLPKGYWWNVIKEQHPELKVPTLKIRLMHDDSLVYGEWMTYHRGGYGGGSVQRSNPTRQALINRATKLYKWWAYDTMWERAMEIQIGEFGKD